MKSKRLFALALALFLALSLAACNLKPAAPWPEALKPVEGLVRGSGSVVDMRTPLSADGRGFALRVGGFSFRGSGKTELSLVIDESLEREIVLTADDNVAERIRVQYDASAGKITVEPDGRVAFAPTKLAIAVGAPVRELAVEGLWKISYDCPSVTECKLAVDGTANGDFIFGELDSLDMRFGGLSEIEVRCAGAKQCKLEADGTLNGKLALGEMDSLDMQLSGLSTLTVSGAAQRAVLSLGGGGVISAFGLTAQDADITMGGLGRCEITAERSLNAVIEGGGSIVYAGSPAVTKRIDGLGIVRAR